MTEGEKLSKKVKAKVILASMAGNALEFYDFYLCGTFASLFAELFFPTQDPTAALLSSLSAFVVGYFVRPIGAIIFGHLGDRLGRKKALTISIFAMAIPTGIIGLLPTYAMIGLWAPILLVACRLIQGICAGGEYNGAAIFAIEHTSKQHKSLAGSMMSVSGGGGALLATFTGYLFTQATMPAWGWRIPFLLGVVLGLIGLYIRHRTGETPDFEKKVSPEPLKKPLLEALSKNPLSVLCCIGGAAFSGALSSTFAAYMNVYMVKVVGLTLSNSMFLNVFGLLTFVALAPVAGWIADKTSPRKVMTASAIALAILFIPVFKLAQHATTTSILAAYLLLTSFAAGFIAPMNQFMNQLFTPAMRYSGIAFGYGVGMATLGGTVPLVATYLISITENTLAPAYYLMSISLLGLLVIALSFKAMKTSDRVHLSKSADSIKHSSRQQKVA